MALVATPLVLLPFLVSSEKVRQRIAEHAQALTGRTISFRDAPRVTFSPFLGIEIANVIVADPNASADDPPLLQMERLRGRLDILPALVGRISISNYQFVRPVFNLRVRENGSVSWAFAKGEVWTVLEQAKAIRATTASGARPDYSGVEPVKLGSFQIIDGTVVHEVVASGTKETVTNFNGSLVWPATGDSAMVDASGIWRGEAFTVKGKLAQPLHLLSGSSSQASFDVASSAITLAFKGEANTLADLQIRGSAKIEAPSVRRLMELAGNPITPGSTLAGFSVSGKLDGTQKLLNFTEAEVALDGNRGSGSLQIAIAGRERPRISGTLAVSSLDASPYFGALRQDAETGRNAVDRLKLADHLEFDLRLSAATARVDKLTLTDLAATFSLRPEEALLEIGNASFMSGMAIASVSAKRSGQDTVLEGRATLTGIDYANLSKALLPSGGLAISGLGGAEMGFKTNGTDLEQMLRNLTGKVRASATTGAISGIDLMQIRLAQPADVPLGGQTAFREAGAEIDLVRDLLLLQKVSLVNSKLRGRLAGKLALASGSIAMRLVVDSGANGDKGGDRSESVFVIGGSVRQPLVTKAPAAPSTTNGGTPAQE